MSTTDSALLRELFEAVADLDPATRANYLDAHCPARLRARLDVLLRADADAGEPVSRTRVGELAGNIGDMPAVAPRPSHRIGPFEVLGLLGEELFGPREDEVVAMAEAQIEVVHELGGVERAARTPSELAPGHRLEAVIDRGEQRVGVACRFVGGTRIAHLRTPPGRV